MSSLLLANFHSNYSHIPARTFPTTAAHHPLYKVQPNSTVPIYHISSNVWSYRKSRAAHPTTSQPPTPQLPDPLRSAGLESSQRNTTQIFSTFLQQLHINQRVPPLPQQSEQASHSPQPEHDQHLPLSPLSPMLTQPCPSHHSPRHMAANYNHLTLASLPTSVISRRTFIRGYINCYSNISQRELNPAESVCLKQGLSIVARWVKPIQARFWMQAFTHNTTLATFGINTDNSTSTIQSGKAFELLQDYNLAAEDTRKLIASIRRVFVIMEYEWLGPIDSSMSLSFYLGYQRDQAGQTTIQIHTYTPLSNILTTQAWRKGEIHYAGRDEYFELVNASILGSLYTTSTNQPILYSPYDVAWQYYIPNVPISFSYIFVKHFGGVHFDYLHKEELFPNTPINATEPMCLINGVMARVQRVMADTAFVGYYLFASKFSTPTDPGPDDSPTIIFDKYSDLVIQCNRFRLIAIDVAMGVSVEIIPVNHELLPFPTKPGESLSDRFISTYILQAPFHQPDKDMVRGHDSLWDRFAFFRLLTTNNHHNLLPQYFLTPEGILLLTGKNFQPFVNKDQCISIYVRRYSLSLVDMFQPLDALPFQLHLEHATRSSFLWGRYSLIRTTLKDYDNSVLLQTGQLDVLGLHGSTAERDLHFEAAATTNQALEGNRISFRPITLSKIDPFGYFLNQSDVTLHISLVLDCNKQKTTFFSYSTNNHNTNKENNSNDLVASAAALSLVYDQNVTSTNHNHSPDANISPISRFRLIHTTGFSPYKPLRDVELMMIAKRVNLTHPRYEKYAQSDIEHNVYRFKFQFTLRGVPNTAPFWYEQNNTYPYFNTTIPSQMVYTEPLRWVDIVMPGEIFAFHGDYNECYILTQGGYQYEHVVPMKIAQSKSHLDAPGLEGYYTTPVQPGEVVNRFSLNYTFSSVKPIESHLPPADHLLADEPTSNTPPEYILTCYDVFLINSTDVDFSSTMDNFRTANPHWRPDQYENAPLLPLTPRNIPIVAYFSHYIAPLNNSNWFLTGTMLEFNPVKDDVWRPFGLALAYILSALVIALSAIWCYSSSDRSSQSHHTTARSSQRTKERDTYLPPLI